MSVRIVTDSTADLPAALAQQLEVTVVPLTVNFGDEAFRDGVDINAPEFLEKLKASKTLPSTSQPSPSAFEDVYRALLEQGHDIVSVHISGKLSGTMNSALLAQSELGEEGRIRIIDSQWTSMALGMTVMRAAHAAQAGKPVNEVVQIVEDACARTHLLLFCDTLEYLKRGGRVGMAGAFLGNLLNVKPMLTLKDGVVAPVERVRTRTRAVEYLWNWASAFPQVEDFCALHIASPEDAESLRARIAARYPDAANHVADVGPVVATHAGPGSVGIALIA